MPVDHTFGYCILEFSSVFSSISEAIVCKHCNGKITFLQSNERGVGFKLLMKCECDSAKTINSSPMIKNAYKINRRLVFTLRILGIGGEGFDKFCGFMDVGNGIGNEGYQSCVNHIHVAASEVSETIFKNAIDEEKQLNAMHGNLEDHLTVSGDGTWKKRGFSSLFGVSTIIGQYSKKAVDAIVKSSFFQ